MYGKPIIVGTRVPIDLLLEKMSKGETIDDLLGSYPHISKEAIYACLRFAYESIKNNFAVLSVTNLRIKKIK